SDLPSLQKGNLLRLPPPRSLTRENAMCGIVGYIGPAQAADFLLEGLRRLEYRGYDSAGVAVVSPQQVLSVRKTVGRIDSLAQRVESQAAPGKIGIGHTRWATHGPAVEENAHPHVG